MLSLDVFIPWWLLDGDSLVFSQLVSTIVTPAWGLVFPELTMSDFFLLNGKYQLPTSSLTLLTKPSLSGRALITWQTFHWFQGVSSSLMMTTSFTWRFFLVRVHFCLSCRERGKFSLPSTAEFISKVLYLSPPFPCIQVSRLEYSWWRQNNLCLQFKEVIWCNCFCGAWWRHAFCCLRSTVNYGLCFTHESL